MGGHRMIPMTACHRQTGVAGRRQGRSRDGLPGAAGGRSTLPGISARARLVSLREAPKSRSTSPHTKVGQSRPRDRLKWERPLRPPGSLGPPRRHATPPTPGRSPTNRPPTASLHRLRRPASVSLSRTGKAERVSKGIFDDLGAEHPSIGVAGGVGSGKASRDRFACSHPQVMPHG